MKKVILIPDSFKGTMSSERICDIMSSVIKKNMRDAEILSIPVADGGEGSVDCFLKALGGERVSIKTCGPFFDELDSFYGLLDSGKTGIIEMAASAGLPLVEDRKDPLRATTYGVGQLMLNAVQNGAEKLIIGLGGSATNDGGCGAAAACGARFIKANGDEFIPAGGTLMDIASIDASGIKKAFGDIEIVAMCDIDNPLYGLNGAAHVFAPQKGAGAETVNKLDAGLEHLAQVIKKDLDLDVGCVPGAGAAGGMGAGMMAFFGARLQMGIEAVLDTVCFDKLCGGADIVFTGEGMFDSQSLGGKVVIGVARRAKHFSVPVIAVCGDIRDSAEAAYEEGVTAIFSTNREAREFSQVRTRAEDDLRLVMENITRLLTARCH